MSARSVLGGDLPLIDDAVTIEHLRRLSSRLTETLGTSDASAVRASMGMETGADRELLGALARLLEQHGATAVRDVYYDGIQNIMAQPEFTETDSVRDVVRFLEDRTRLVSILPADLGAGAVHVAIGSEHRLEHLRGFSLVFGRYGGGSDVVGYVGVMGPTRMDYARSIGAVRYVGSLMSDLVRVMEGD